MKLFDDSFKKSIKDNGDRALDKVKNTSSKKWVIIAVALVVLIGILFALLRDTPEDIVRDGTMYNYPEKTVEQAFDDFFGEGYGQWFEYQDGNVSYTVNKNNQHMTITFWTNKEDKSFGLVSIIIDGVDCTYIADEIFYDIYNMNYM